MMISQISLVKSLEHTQGVQAALVPFEKELKRKLSEIESLVIKVNFVSTYEELATTPFLAVKTFVDFILPFYQKQIIIAEEVSLGDTKQAFKKYGFTGLASEIPQIKLLDLAQDQVLEKTLPYPGGELLLPLSKTLVEAPFLVSITRPKTHDAVVITLGIKNVLVGVIAGGFSWRSKIHKGKSIHQIMTEIAAYAYPHFVLIDGTVGMEGEGPVSGTPIKAGWSLASFDALAADSLAAYLMGFKTEDIGYFNLLRERNFGQLYPKDRIEVLGVKPEKLITPFEPYPTFEQQKNWR